MVEVLWYSLAGHLLEQGNNRTGISLLLLGASPLHDLTSLLWNNSLSVLKNSILIIEDAERVISDREGNGSPAGVSNILNLTDGILGDCLSIQIVATFNMKREKIDQALLRKGRLIVEHRFGKLSPEESNKLLKHLEKDHIVEESMCLADIYNIDVELIKTSNKSKIGF